MIAMSPRYRGGSPGLRAARRSSARIQQALQGSEVGQVVLPGSQQVGQPFMVLDAHDTAGQLGGEVQVEAGLGEAASRPTQMQERDPSVVAPSPGQ